MSGPVGVYLHVTRRCNLACAYCYGACGPHTSGELGEPWVEILAEEIRHAAPERLTLTGGEPLLHPRLFEMAETLRAACDEVSCRLRLATNGLLMDVARAARVAELFDEVRVSLDGPPEINDALRGGGSYEGAMSALRKLLGAGIAPSVAVTVSRLNLPGLAVFLGWLHTELGIAQIHVSPLRPAGRALLRPDLACAWRDVRDVVADHWSRNFQSLGRKGAEEVDERASLLECAACGIGDYLSIEADGGVYPCHVLTRPEFRLGSIADGLEHAAQLAGAAGTALASGVSSAASPQADVDGQLRAACAEAICLGEILPLLPPEARRRPVGA